MTNPTSERKLKILMLHGYTQNGPLFHAKTRALEKLLNKAFPASKASPIAAQYPGGVQLIYPTGPIRLQAADIPGFDVNAAGGEEREAFGWWKRETGSGNYIGLNDGLGTIAATIKAEGGIDGVIGFSQGAAGAGFVASLLEPGRVEAFAKREPQGGIEYPEAFELGQVNPRGMLKFAVSYSGFYAPNEAYRAFYEPKIATSMLHFIGSLDTVVEESRCLALVKACEKETVIYHPGGHFVPIGKEMAGQLIGFIKECCSEKKVEESVEDMDMPF
ncbi:hypothetical protein BP5796_11237 [Coleophoma crateriformis]|uniref:Serine hydrolase domain-containing protein n=1 Tax=Coleophoma crateriformis TaxID=565419 RepID=A0A3D8QHR4_9HELO|nr:hypothetical protein BP5796_11237 [Coleophoma crateriformis]